LGYPPPLRKGRGSAAAKVPKRTQRRPHIRQPKLRRQKGSGRPDRAFVVLAGRKIFCGRWGTEEAQQKYARLLGEYEAGKGTFPQPKEAITVLELVARFWAHAEEYYRKADGTPTGTAENFRLVLRPLKELYGPTRAAEFGPRALKALREHWIKARCSRNYVNGCVMKVRQVFRWGVAEELVPAATYQALQAVAGLRRGRSAARETEPVRPVLQTHIDAIGPHVSRQVWALVQLQLLTGARAGELLGMRAVDLDMSARIWVYTPEGHKTAHHGHGRAIYLGPKAQEILRSFLSESRPLDAPLFSPAEAEEERRARREAQRKTPLSCGNRRGTNRKKNPSRRPKDRYTTGTYRNAIQRACKTAGVPAWHPHQLRHNAGTYLRKEFGLEVARVILGHRSPAITDLYAEVDRARALEVMERIG
jgi:integrase